MSTAPLAANDKSAWIRDLVYLAFPEGEARERVLFDLVKQFAKMDPEDPEWRRYKLSVVECRALENVARGLNDAATEQARLRGVTREIADFAATQMKGSIDSAAQATRQLLEDVQVSLHEAIAGDAILKSYSEETRKHFATVIKSLIDDALTRALTVVHGRMDEWVKKTLEFSMAEAQKALSAANDDFKSRLTGVWGRLLWASIGGGLMAGAFLLAGGFWLGRNW
ncbi:MAG: hypothetical protein WCA21_00510 [Terracidiphilus sp.]